MNNLDDILNALKANADFLKNLGVNRIGIFGSVARGNSTLDSDIDVFVEFTPAGHTFKNFNWLCDFGDTQIGENYDLITPQSLKPCVHEKLRKR